jgi:hypothetical protein
MGQRFSIARATPKSRLISMTANSIAYNRNAWVSDTISSADTIPAMLTIR